MNERFSVILMLSLSFTEQVKAIYCFNALVCVIITRPRSYEGSFATLPLLWPLISCAPFTFPVISSPVSGFSRIPSLRKANFGSLVKRVGLRETGWVLPPQLPRAAARCSWGSSQTAWCRQRCAPFCFGHKSVSFTYKRTRARCRKPAFLIKMSMLVVSSKPF